jgi:aspartate/methionine/tyrosine aminotransferase
MRMVQSPVVPVVGELIKAHPGTISLGQGVVYYGPPPQAFDRLRDFTADAENNKYKLVQGIAPLLEELTKKLAAENGIQLSRANALLVTAGGNMAFMNAILAITDPGDEVILPLPYYFNHEMAIVMAGGKPVLVSTDDNYQLCPDALAAAVTPRTRAIVTVSPNNPTGAVYSESALRAVNDLCRRKGIYHISDEAYEYFLFAPPSGAKGCRPAAHFSPASMEGSAGHTISLYSLSKAYGFASWRIGYMIVPEALATPVKKIQDTILICAPVISQFAALGALAAGRSYCQTHLEKIASVRELFLNEFETIRSFCVVPPADGAFYFVLRLDTALEPMCLIERLVREHGVAAIPGTAFGMDRGCAIRVAYGSLPREKAAEGIGRLMRGLKSMIGCSH